MKINNLFNVEGRIAVVTGGSRGIGEMIAAGFLANGVKVYITARKEAALIEKAKELTNVDKKSTKYVGVLVNPKNEELEKENDKLKFFNRDCKEETERFMEENERLKVENERLRKDLKDLK